MKPVALIVKAAGTNRDADVARAFELAGADTFIASVKWLKDNKSRFASSSILVIPGGFSYADALGAGSLFALDLASFFKDEVREFVEGGKPVLGICNGFQALVKAGILPGAELDAGLESSERSVTLARNENGLFECRWVSMRAHPGSCLWTEGIREPFSCPVAHGEGRFTSGDASVLERLKRSKSVALSYCLPSGAPAGGRYPDNPNGSAFDIAGISNSAGNVLGLMPHPEDNIASGSGAFCHGAGSAGDGLSIFLNGVRYAAQS